MCSHMCNALRLRRSNGTGHHVPHPPGQNLPHQEPRGRHWPRTGPVEIEYTALRNIYFIFYLQKHKGWPTRRVLVIFYDNFTKPVCKKNCLTHCFNFSSFLLNRFECVSRRRHKIMIRPQRSPYISFLSPGRLSIWIPLSLINENCDRYRRCKMHAGGSMRRRDVLLQRVKRGWGWFRIQFELRHN